MLAGLLHDAAGHRAIEPAETHWTGPVAALPARVLLRPAAAQLVPAAQLPQRLLNEFPTEVGFFTARKLIK